MEGVEGHDFLGMYSIQFVVKPQNGSLALRPGSLGVMTHLVRSAEIFQPSQHVGQFVALAEIVLMLPGRKHHEAHNGR